MLPAIALLIGSWWQVFFSVIPTYWPLKLYFALDKGEALAGVYFAVGLAYELLLLRWLIGRFTTVLHR
jgi:hypothetical protein